MGAEKADIGSQLLASEKNIVFYKEQLAKTKVLIAQHAKKQQQVV